MGSVAAVCKSAGKTEAPPTNISSGMASGYRKAQNSNSTIAAGFNVFSFSKESENVVATDSGWSWPEAPLLFKNNDEYCW